MFEDEVGDAVRYERGLAVKCVACILLVVVSWRSGCTSSAEPAARRLARRPQPSCMKPRPAGTSRPCRPHPRPSAHPVPRRGPGRGSLAPLVAVTGAALVFTLLLALVRLQWRPLESVDHGAAARINGLVAGHPALISVVKAVTWLGSDGVLWTVIGVSAVFLAVRRRWRLAGYLLVAGAGALVMDPILKSLVGRLRPVVAHPVAHGNGNSFPSGHSLGSIVCYGAVLLVFLPTTRGRWRTVLRAVLVTLVALIGISRILLGVHFLSDVAGGWTLGITWLGLTAFAFELSRRAEGQPVTDPLAEGLEPEAGTDPDSAPPEAPMNTSAARPDSPLPAARPIAAGLVMAWVLILGVIVGFGELVVKDSNGNWLGDTTIPRWFAAHRTPLGNQWSDYISVACATTGILIVAVTACVVFLVFTRHWRPVVFLAVVMFGELGAFLIAEQVVGGPGPTCTTSTTTCPPRPTRPGTWPPPAACTSRSRSWSSGTPGAGGGGCSWSPRS